MAPSNSANVLAELDEEIINDHYALPSIKSKNGEYEENYEEMFNSEGLYSSFNDSLYDVDGDSLLMFAENEDHYDDYDAYKLGSVLEEDNVDDSNNDTSNNKERSIDLSNNDDNKKENDDIALSNNNHDINKESAVELSDNNNDSNKDSEIDLSKLEDENSVSNNSSSKSSIQEIISNDSTVLEEHIPKVENLVVDKNTEAACDDAVANEYVIGDQDEELIEEAIPTLTAYDAHYDQLNTATSHESNNYYDDYNFQFTATNLGGSDDSDIELDNNEEDFRQIIKEIQDKLQLTKDSIEKVKISTPSLLNSDVDDIFNSSIFATGSMLEISKAVETAKRNSESSSEAISCRLNNAMKNIATTFENSGTMSEDDHSLNS